MFSFLQSKSESFEDPVPNNRNSLPIIRRFNINRVVSQESTALIVPGRELIINDKLRTVNELLKKYIQPLFDDEEGKLNVLVNECNPGTKIQRLEDLEEDLIVMEKNTFVEHFRLLEQ